MTPQGLLLLLLLGGDCATCFPEYHIWQPCQLTARPKGSITLPCTFNYTWEAEETAEVFWRLGNYHGNFFFTHTHNITQRYTDPNYERRVSLVGDPSKRLEASIQIEDLRESDSNLYFCTVSVQTLRDGVKYWRNIDGTNLTVTGLPLPDPPSLVGLVIGAAAVAVILALALLAFVAWRKGCCSKCPQRRRASLQSKEEPDGREFEAFPIEVPKAPPPASPQPPACAPPLAPKDSGGLLYADLNLAGGRGRMEPSQIPEGGRGEETTYAILRH